MRLRDGQRAVTGEDATGGPWTATREQAREVRAWRRMDSGPLRLSMSGFGVKVVGLVREEYQPCATLVSCRKGCSHHSRPAVAADLC